ncbi:MAG TPA: hypothetical protein VFI27_19535 [candidate division Zixibacteria bacterium]|nr:hypothetical protein [candidate division Zixibacteria bacterium]
MAESSRKLNMHRPAVFRICIQGELDEDWFEYFGAQSASVETDKMGNAITVIMSEPMDQAALVGLVNHLNALGIPLISVEPI